MKRLFATGRIGISLLAVGISALATVMLAPIPAAASGSPGSETVSPSSVFVGSTHDLVFTFQPNQAVVGLLTVRNSPSWTAFSASPGPGHIGGLTSTCTKAAITGIGATAITVALNCRSGQIESFSYFGASAPLSPQTSTFVTSLQSPGGSGQLAAQPVVQVEPGPASSIRLTLSSNTVTAQVSTELLGPQTVTATAAVADPFGNPMTSEPVLLATSGDASVSLVTNNGDGTYAATITASSQPDSGEAIVASDGALQATQILTETPYVSLYYPSSSTCLQWGYSCFFDFLNTYGFAQGETVNVTFAGTEVGACVPTYNDYLQTTVCQVSFFLPAEPLGAYEVVATGASSGYAASTAFVQDS